MLASPPFNNGTLSHPPTHPPTHPLSQPKRRRTSTYPPTHPPTYDRPWAVNLAGIPIWCSFGPVSTGGIGNHLGNAHAGAEMSTARVTPLMRQHGNVLHAVYLSGEISLSPKLVTSPTNPPTHLPTNPPTFLNQQLPAVSPSTTAIYGRVCVGRRRRWRRWARLT